MWNNLGSAPGATVREVTVIGPGHGESVVIHLGNGEWLVIDSCGVPSQSGESAPLKYLHTLGVDVSQAVKLIVVSHWDDDHVRGISKLLEASTSATFCCAASLTKRDFSRFVEVVSLGGKTTNKGNVSEFRRCLEILAERPQGIRYAAPGRPLSNIGQPIVKSWSPSDFDNTCFLEYVAANYPTHMGAMKRAVPGSPNLTSVVISVDWDDTSVLLGADMEASPDVRRGWGAVVSEATRLGFPKGQLVKIPHHGSEGAHDDRMWSDLLQPNPISVTAPFGKGATASRPPLPRDVNRIVGKSSKAYLTARRDSSSIKKKDPAVARSLREGGIRLSSPNTVIGMVRMRKVDGGNWDANLFGDAVRVK